MRRCDGMCDDFGCMRGNGRSNDGLCEGFRV